MRLISLLISYGQYLLLAIRLAGQIFHRTIGAKYRKSFLGYFWMIVPAVVIGGGVSVAKLSGTINPGVTGLPYPLFVFIGVIIWMIFVELLDVPYQAFDGARSYLTRVNFPREAVVLVQVYESLVGAAGTIHIFMRGHCGFSECFQLVVC